MAKIPLIRFKEVEKSFLAKKPIFSGVNMEVEKGEFLFLTGISGAGKSTMFRLLIGLETADRGEILFNGKVINQMSPYEVSMHRRNIGVVFQDYKLLVQKTAAENIAIPMRIQGLSSNKVDKMVKQIAAKIGIEDLLKQPIQSLSGGEQQLVAIARASIHGPKAILADEPTANLDQKTANRIIAMLSKLNEEGITVIIATHDINLLKSQSRRILLIKNARLMEVTP